MTQKIFLGKLLDIAELTSVVVDSDNDQKNFEEAARGQREGGDEVKPSLQQEGGREAAEAALLNLYHLIKLGWLEKEREGED